MSQQWTRHQQAWPLCDPIILWAQPKFFQTFWNVWNNVGSMTLGRREPYHWCLRLGIKLRGVNVWFQINPSYHPSVSTVPPLRMRHHAGRWTNAWFESPTISWRCSVGYRVSLCFSCVVINRFRWRMNMHFRRCQLWVAPRPCNVVPVRSVLWCKERNVRSVSMDAALRWWDSVFRNVEALEMQPARFCWWFTQGHGCVSGAFMEIRPYALQIKVDVEFELTFLRFGQTDQRIALWMQAYIWAWSVSCAMAAVSER